MCKLRPGKASGALVTRCLGPSNVDPIALGLYFEPSICGEISSPSMSFAVEPHGMAAAKKLLESLSRGLAVRERWHTRELSHQLQSGLFEQTVLHPPKVSSVMRQMHPEATEVFKDAYFLDFLELAVRHLEGDLPRAILGNLQRFILQMAGMAKRHFGLCVSGLLTCPMKRLWVLDDLTKVAIALGMTSKEAASSRLLAKDFRNLIHPGKAIRLSAVFDRGTALAAATAVELVAREIRSSQAKGNV
jgi:hypothetical protein